MTVRMERSLKSWRKLILNHILDDTEVYGFIVSVKKCEFMFF